MALFGMALGLAIAIEGLLYAVLPGQMKRMMAQVLGTGDDALRFIGLGTASFGVALVWIAHFFMT